MSPLARLLLQRGALCDIVGGKGMQESSQQVCAVFWGRDAAKISYLHSESDTGQEQALDSGVSSTFFFLSATQEAWLGVISRSNDVGV